MKSLALIPTILSALPLAAADLSCRPEGPVVLRPVGLGESKTVTDAGSKLTSSLNKAVAGDIKAGWAVENTTFSLAVVSIDQEDPGVPLWEYHHLAEANVNGTKSLNRDTQYLIGSVSKAFSDLALLKSGLNLDDPVTKYLPELRNCSSPVNWQAITLRALGNHLAGVPSNYGFSEYAFLGEVFQSLGFPSLEPSDYPLCGVIGLSEGCTKETLLKGLASAIPITAVGERPAYSNLAFTLISLAIQEATGKNYTAQIADYIAEPLGLTTTFPSPGDSEKAVIPPVENSWGSDYGLNAPAGGLVSTLSDISKFSHSILSRKALSPSQTRAWLKPDSLTGSLHTLVGLPWEIYRPPGLLADHPSYVPTIYAKSGGAYGYRAQIGLLDSHGVAFVLLTAGDMQALPYLYDAMLATFVPAVDAVSRDQAEQQLARNFSSHGCTAPSSSSPGGNSTDDADACVHATLSLNSSIELTALTRGGQDILAGLTVLWENTIGSQLSPIEPSYQLYPTEDLQRAELPDGRKVTREAWRFWLTSIWSDPSLSELPGQGTGSKDCTSWTLNDWIHYGSQPIDRVVVVRDAETGEVVGLDVPFLRSGLLAPDDE